MSRFHLIKYISGFATAAILSCLALNPLSAQVNLTSQAEVDAFDPTITRITGNLVIGQTLPTDITDLSNLINLTEVTGLVRISSNRSLVNLRGLDNLTRVGQRLSIGANSIVSLEGLNVQSIGGDLSIEDNTDLANIDALRSLTTVPGDLSIHNNAELLNLDGLENIIKADLLSLFRCPKLINLDGARNMIDLPSISLAELPSITDFSLIENLKNLVSVALSRLDQMKTLEPLRNFDSLASLTLTRLNELISLDGLINLEHIDYLYIVECDTLKSLKGLDNLRSADYFRITNNQLLEDCCPILNFLRNPDRPVLDLNINNPLLPCSTPDEVLKECGFNFFVNTNDPCIDASNGIINLLLVNDLEYPIEYEWINKDDGTSGAGTTFDDQIVVQDLPAGCYNITVTSAKPDTVIRENIILSDLDGNIFEIVEVESVNSSNSLPNGSIKLKINGGQYPLSAEWAGPKLGSENNIITDSLFLENMPSGEYSISLTDAFGKSIFFKISLLDEEVPIIPCTQAIDLIILNDVSGSVSTVEYQESKEFFTNILDQVNIGTGPDETQGAIIEFGESSQLVVDFTGDISKLQNYFNLPRSGGSGTDPLQALAYGYNYLNTVGRPNAQKLIVLSTDASFSQLPNSLVAYADELKAKGINIVTIAFDGAFSTSGTRKRLQEIASNDLLAPGAPAYSLLDQEIARKIVNLYICPIDPGSFAQAYFYRDGAINLTDITTLENCPYAKEVEVEFTITASRDLSIPSGMPVSFYFNDPESLGSEYILTFTLPCSMAAGMEESYTVTLPVAGPGNIYGVLNDDGTSAPPINFPITTIEELAYSNNIDNITYCSNEATIEVKKITDTPNPVCGNQISYTVEVCNISDIDAEGIIFEDVAPPESKLTSFIFNSNSCGSVNNDVYEIPANCCISFALEYNVSEVELGDYTDQDALIDGPSNQVYINFDGQFTDEEDVTLDGTVDCPSTNIEFTKEVNQQEYCDDNFLEFKFKIKNETLLPLRNMTFRDTLPEPCYWVFKPYNVEGLDISTFEIDSNIISVTVSNLGALKQGEFTLDAQLSTWPVDGMLVNQAYLERVPDFDQGGYKELTSNSTTTNIIAAPEIDAPDTIWIDIAEKNIELTAELDLAASFSWATEGDGNFTDPNNFNTQYEVGLQDSIAGVIELIVTAETACHQVNKNVTIILSSCAPIVNLTEGDCNDNGTPQDKTDDYFELNFNAITLLSSSQYNLEIDDQLEGLFDYDSDYKIQIPADSIARKLVFTDRNNTRCNYEILITRSNCSNECALEFLTIESGDCNDNNTPTDPSDDTYKLTFNLNAVNAGPRYTLFVAGEAIDIFDYESMNTIQLPADGVMDTLRFVDINDQQCLLDTIISGSASCSDECLIELLEFSLGECDNSGTLTETADDSLNILFKISKENALLDDRYLVTKGQNSFGPFPYNEEGSLKLAADGLEVDLSFMDLENNACNILTQNFRPEPCSDGCDLTFNFIEVELCDDNGTPEIETDDTFLLSFDISPSEGMDSELFNLSLDDEFVNTFAYDMLHNISLSANGIEFILSFEDEKEAACMLEYQISQAHCSYVDKPELYIPNIFFTGDSSTENREWQILASDPSIEIIECFVFDRWGNLMFQSNDSKEIKWDGTRNGEKIETGVYSYRLAYSVDGELINQAGTITHIR